MTRQRKVLVADLFCGAGGSSTGAQRALSRIGLDMDLLCVNHWDTAIATHTLNHPKARHYCQDINTVRPSQAVPGGKLDLLMASPTCTHHSRARGGKPTSDQQRMDPWHVVTWLTELRVRCLIIENVPEFRDWGPVDARTGSPIKSRKGEYFRSWVKTIEGLGFKLDHRILNAADFGDVTTRQRFFLIARSDGKRLSWPAPTHARNPDKGDMFDAGLQRWRPAREIIEWDRKGKSIFARKRPLSPKTLARIYAGAVKFKWPEPFLVVLRNHMDAQSVDGPLPAITAGGTHIGLAEPFVLSTQSRRFAMVLPVTHGKGGNRARDVETSPLATITCAPRGEFAFIVAAFGERPGQTPRIHSVDDPAPTICATGRVQLVEPFVFGCGGRAGQSPLTGAESPLGTITTKNDRCVATPGEGYDILFRMLEPSELARAMGFSDADADYEFAGNKTEITKQIGNAVPVNTATALVSAMMADIGAQTALPLTRRKAA